MGINRVNSEGDSKTCERNPRIAEFFSYCPSSPGTEARTLFSIAPVDWNFIS